MELYERTSNFIHKYFCVTSVRPISFSRCSLPPFQRGRKFKSKHGLLLDPKYPQGKTTHHVIDLVLQKSVNFKRS